MSKNILLNYKVEFFEKDTKLYTSYFLTKKEALKFMYDISFNFSERITFFNENKVITKCHDLYNPKTIVLEEI